MIVGVAVNGSDHDIVYSYVWLCEEQDLYVPLVDRGGRYIWSSYFWLYRYILVIYWLYYENIGFG